MDQPEIILNLWYECDTEGVIYSLRARAYLGSGTTTEKLALLRQSATTDYLIARSFPIPETFCMDSKPVTHKSVLEFPGASIALFAEAIETLQSELPVQTPLDIPDQPLICLTPLLRDDEGGIQPVITGEKYL